MMTVLFYGLSLAISIVMMFGCWFALTVLFGGHGAALPVFQQVSTRNAPAVRNKSRQALTVLIPAHNEEACLKETLESIKADFIAGASILVVADNCTDATPEIARAAGAECIERKHDTLRGKGYALAHGREHLCEAAPDVVVVVDADCRLMPGSLAALAEHVQQTGYPGQALYLLEAHSSSNSSLGERISAFAIRIKNYVRARGLAKLSLPVQLSGSGMAFSFEDFKRLNLATGHLAEDLYFGLLLAKDGRGARFVEKAFVRSVLPSIESASESQRTRWVHGHVQVMTGLAPRVIFGSLMKGKFGAAFLAFDAMVPPLVPLLALLISLTAITILFALVYQGAAIFLAMSGLLTLFLMGIALLLAWVTVGRDLIHWRDIIGILAAIPKRVAVMIGAIFKPERRWVRTARDDVPKKEEYDKE